MNQASVQTLAKVPTGIAGVDEITRGGIPRGRVTLLCGGPGSGKTIFALQTLANGIERWNEPAVFVAFEEDPVRLRANMASFNWSGSWQDEQRLFFFDAQLSPEVILDGSFDLSGTLSLVAATVRKIGATRVVFDGLDVLLMLLDNPAAERREIHRLHRWILDSGMTGIITVKADDFESGGLQTSRYETLQFMADCVITFQHRLLDQKSSRSLRVVKYRGSSHPANEFPLAISSDGLEVAGHTFDELTKAASAERVPTGVDRLDGMLSDGYFQGSTVLLTGAPGTAKTTLASLFTDAACRRGERALFVSFDEAGEVVVRNVSSVGINLAPHVASDLLRIYGIRSNSLSPQEHLVNIIRLMKEHQPRCMVIDPLSAISKAGGNVAGSEVAVRLIDIIRASGVTLLITSLLSQAEGDHEESAIPVSTVADTWIHLSYVVTGGERNRALTVIKSRGMRHSNQVRELLLSDNGVTLSDVYLAEGQVLMGTARVERESRQRREDAERQIEASHRRLALEARQRELQAELDSLNARMDSNKSELSLLSTEENLLTQERDREIADRLAARGGADGG